MELTAGSRWRSAVCDTEVVVVKAPSSEIDLQCGGAAMLDIGSPKPDGGAPSAGLDTPTPVGKRFADEGSGLELLATKGGAGTLSIGAEPIPLKGAKPLPSSD